MRRPKFLEDAGLDIYLDESKLRDLDIPVTQMQVSELEWLLDLPVWEMDNTDEWNLTPRQVLENKPYTMNHRKAIESADLAYPIVVTFNKEKWVILDGFHRLAKTYLLNQVLIKVKIITSDMQAYKDALI